MKRTEKTILLDDSGVDTISAEIQDWLEKAEIKHVDILRIRLMAEEVLGNIRRHYKKKEEVKLILQKMIGSYYIVVRYGGRRYDPIQQSDEQVPELTRRLLEQTGLKPRWHWRANQNELILQIPGLHFRPEQLMLGCIALAVVTGLAGPFIPLSIRTMITEYGLLFLADGFMNLLNTFIGLMVFLSVVNGICGIGNASTLGKVGKLMISRYVGMTFLLNAFFTLTSYFSFHLRSGGTGSGSQIHSIFEVIFGILPANPVGPFLEGNTLQIVFVAVMVGTILVLTGSQTEHLQTLISEMHQVTMRCVSVVCVFLPVFIFSSLVSQLWSNGPDLFVRFGKPLLLCVVMNLIAMGGYLILSCLRLHVKPSVVLPKILPPFLIGLATSSSAAALPSLMDTNEKKLGIDPSYSKVASPIGTILFASTCAMVFVLNAAFLANYYGLQVNGAWWITLWIISTLISMSVPPVAGGIISCQSVLLNQMGIPQEGLALAVTLVMIMDFLCTASRLFLLQLEIALQADHQKLLNHELLEQK